MTSRDGSTLTLMACSFARGEEFGEARLEGTSAVVREVYRLYRGHTDVDPEARALFESIERWVSPLKARMAVRGAK